MSPKIDFLIDKKDNFELVRNKIALILFEEKEHQKDLAIDAGKNPKNWDFDVYIERAFPWQLLQDVEGRVIQDKALINIYYDSGDFSSSQSTVVNQQKHDVLYYIDCYSSKMSLQEQDGNIISGDKRASLDIDRIIRLVRNILMSSFYTYLDLRLIVWRRWIQNIRKFQPAIEDRPVQNVMAGRITFNVGVSEFSPQYAALELEELHIELSTKLGEGPAGELIILNYDLTKP